MRKDIDIPQVENVHIVAVKEWNEELTDQFWNVYVVNNRKEEISMVLVISRGSDADRKTSTIRQNLGDIQSQNSVDRKSTRLNSSHVRISYAVFCLKKKKKQKNKQQKKNNK